MLNYLLPFCILSYIYNFVNSFYIFFSLNLSISISHISFILSFCFIKVFIIGLSTVIKPSISSGSFLITSSFLFCSFSFSSYSFHGKHANSLHDSDENVLSFSARAFRALPALGQWAARAARAVAGACSSSKGSM